MSTATQFAKEISSYNSGSQKFFLEENKEIVMSGCKSVHLDGKTYLMSIHSYWTEKTPCHKYEVIFEMNGYFKIEITRNGNISQYAKGKMVPC